MVLKLDAIYEKHPLSKEITTFAIPIGFAGATLTLSSGTLDNDLFTIRDGKLWWISTPDYESPADSDTNNIYEIEVTFTKTDDTTTRQRYDLEVQDIGPGRYGYNPNVKSDGGVERYSFSRSSIPEPLELEGLASYLITNIAYAVPDEGPLILTWALGSDPHLDADLVRPFLHYAFALYEEAINIKFVEVEPSSGYDFSISFLPPGTKPGAGASAYTLGNVRFYYSEELLLHPTNSYAQDTIIHELGHALGLRHPFGGSLGNDYKYSPDTIMSYARVRGEKLHEADIEALQFLYGAPGDDDWISPRSLDIAPWVVRSIAETTETQEAFFVQLPLWHLVYAGSHTHAIYGFSLRDEDDSALFQIDRDTGLVSLKQTLEYDDVDAKNNIYSVEIGYSYRYGIIRHGLINVGTRWDESVLYFEVIESINLAAGDSDIDIAKRGKEGQPGADYRGKQVLGSDGNNDITDGHGHDIIRGRGGDDVIRLDTTYKDHNQIIYRIGNQLAIDGGDTIIDFVRGVDRFILALDDTAATRAITDNAGLIQYLKGGTADNQSDDQFLVKLDMVIDPETGAVLVAGLSLHFKDSVFYDGGRKSVPVMVLKFSESVKVEQLLGGDETSRAKIIDENGILLDLNVLEHLLGGVNSFGYTVETDTRTPNKVNAPAANRIAIDATMTGKVLSDAGGDDTYLIQTDAADGVVINDAAGKSTIIFADGVRVLSVVTHTGVLGVNYAEITFDNGANTAERILRVEQLDQAHFQFEAGLLSARDLNIDALKAYAEGVPSFRADSYSAQLATNAEVGTVVATISAANVNDRAELNYAFTRDGNLDNLGNLFAIDGRTGVITLNTALPPSAATSYVLKVQATNGTYTSTATVIVNIGDVSQPSEGDTLPPTPVVPDAPTTRFFTQTDYTVIVAEDTAVGAWIFDDLPLVMISDTTSRSPRIISGDSDLFGIVGYRRTSYKIVLKGALNYEDATSHTLTLQLSDGTNTDTATFTVLVTDVEEPGPVFSDRVINNGSLITHADEDDPIGAHVSWLYVKDSDTDLDALTFSIIGGNDDGLFAIKPPASDKTAQLVLAGNLDYETASLHVLTIQVSDGEKTDIVKVKVSVRDVNESAPTFTQTSYTATIADDAPSDALVTAVRSLTGHRYSFAENGNPDGLFAIHRSTGAITLAETLDGTTATTHTLTVKVSDGENTPSTATVTVTVKEAIGSTPVVVNGGLQYAPNVDEDSPIGHMIAPIQSVRDADDDDLSYSIIDGNDDGLFAIDDTGRYITLAGKLDYRTASEHFLTIQASDGTNTASYLLYVRLNAPDPIFDEAVYTANVAENVAIGATVTTVFAKDREIYDKLSLATYSIIEGNADNLFAIDAETGIITVAGALDYETTTTYTLTVQATSGPYYERVSSTAKVTINVTDIAEPAPVFDVASYTLTMTEDAAIGSLVTLVHAKNFASDTLSYSIIGGNSNDLFAIEDHNGISGRITLKGALDYRTANSHTLTIQVSDGESTATTTVVVNIIKPYIGVVESAEIGDAVAVISVFDIGTSGVTYSIASGNDDGVFNLDGNTLRLNTALDYEDATQAKTYSIVVNASDGTTTRTATLTIEVVDANDNAPILTEAVADARGVVTENMAGADTGIALRLADVDSAGVNDLTFDITNTDGVDQSAVFALVEDAGLWRLKLAAGATLDYETASVIALQITANDGRTDSDTITVYVDVQDANDNAPILTEAVADARGVVTENMAGADTGIALRLADVDSAGVNDLTFDITNTDGVDQSAVFALVEDAGLWRLKLAAGATLDYETASVIALQITANDGRTDSDTITVYVDVQDANDNAPILTEAVADARGVVTENMAGADTGIALRLADVDSAGVNDLTFDITNTDGVDQSAVFALVEDAGLWRLKLAAGATLDYETASVIALQITANDGRTDSDTITVYVDVEYVNDGKAEIAIRGNDGAAVNADSDLANVDVGWELTAVVTSADPEGYQGGATPTSGWFWFYQSKPDEDIGDGSATYAIKGSDANEQIGVRLTYTDGNGRPGIVEARLEEAVKRVVIKPDAEDAGKDKTYTVETNKATKVEGGTGADRVRDGERNDIINGGQGDDEIDLGASKTDNDVVVYGIGNQMASDGSDSITGFVRGRDKFVFQLKQSDIDASGMTLGKDDGIEAFIDYVTKNTARLGDDEFMVSLNFDFFTSDEITLSGISFLFEDSTFFSGGRISMPIVSIEFADAVALDELSEIVSTSDTPVVNRQGLIVDLDYLDDFLGGDDSVGFEII